MDMKVKYRQPALPPQAEINERDETLISLIQTGLPLTERPYADLGVQVGMTEEQVINRIAYLNESKIIKRFGVVVRHHELGYKANAMTVWNIDDDKVSMLGTCMGEFDFVTLCYRRPRRLPEWPYNLFTMIHGKDREHVLSNIELLANQCDLGSVEHQVLFSTQRFKQRGAIYRKL